MLYAFFATISYYNARRVKSITFSAVPRFLSAAPCATMTSSISGGADNEQEQRQEDSRAPYALTGFLHQERRQDPRCQHGGYTPLLLSLMFAI